MNRLLLATRSADKAREIREILRAAGAGVELQSLDEAHVHWASEEERLERFDSFEANARAKAEYFAKLTGLPTVADDSGIEVLSLGGAPGVRSKRFSPESSRLAGKELDAANNAELLRRLLGADEKRRRACYVCVALLLRHPGATPEAFTGRSWGRILVEPRGTGGFGYDPLFFHEGLGKAFGEATAEEKHGVSHRGDAFRQLAAALARHPL
ncbi:MAG TPA: non-canonical purine NTP pyrophosphatase [Gemmatimonadales bacterium]|nr:non-canonical purine NTP pyrophosphatase [Gemmatimonadales bacterium]